MEIFSISRPFDVIRASATLFVEDGDRLTSNDVSAN
jgi:transcriptional regulator GlxA family with amidase domain